MSRAIVVGCGQLGASIATRMSAEGWSVTVIDRDAGAFAKLPASLSASCFVGDALAGEVMERAGAHGSDVVISATDKDELNVVVGVAAQRLFQARCAIARVRAPKHADSYALVGVETMCSTAIEATFILRHVDATLCPGVMRIVMIGCGCLGAHVAGLLAKRGHYIIAVDSDERRLDSLTEIAGEHVFGDATEPCVLERAHTREADLVVVATHDDNVNLTASLVAWQILKVKNLIVRIQDPRREALFEGVTTLCSASISANATLDIISRLVGLGALST